MASIVADQIDDVEFAEAARTIVLRALRNPTDAMLASPNTAYLISRVGRVAFLQAWRDAIDAAIGESK